MHGDNVYLGLFFSLIHVVCIFLVLSISMQEVTPYATFSLVNK